MSLWYCFTCQIVTAPYEGNYCHACGSALVPCFVDEKLIADAIATHDGDYGGVALRHGPDVGSDVPGGGAA